MAKTIMVVDDEKRLVSLVESYLAQEGYRVVSANNGKEALPIASREKPDLIILDIMIQICLNAKRPFGINISTEGSL